MVNDSSSDRMLTKKADKTIQKPIKDEDNRASDSKDTANKSSPDNKIKSDLSRSSTEKYPYIVEVPSNNK